eukprot:scaffold3423_cov26-Tisochrysis_lutea.AAC.3
MPRRPAARGAARRTPRPSWPQRPRRQRRRGPPRAGSRDVAPSLLPMPRWRPTPRGPERSSARARHRSEWWQTPRLLRPARCAERQLTPAPRRLPMRCATWRARARLQARLAERRSPPATERQLLSRVAALRRAGAATRASRLPAAPRPPWHTHEPPPTLPPTP